MVKVKEQNVLEILGLENLPEDEKKKVLEDITETINNRVFARVLLMLSDEDKKEMIKLAEGSQGTEAVNQFLVKHFPDLDTMLEDLAKEETGKYAELAKFSASGFKDDAQRIMKE